MSAQRPVVPSRPGPSRPEGLGTDAGVGPSSSRSTNSSSSCERCAQLEDLLKRAEAANAELGMQLGGLEMAVRRAGQAEMAMRTELRRVTETEPEADDVRELLHLWREEVMGGSKRVKLTVASERGKRCKWALKNYGKERASDAIRGVTLDDWAMGRSARSNGRAFNDLAKHVFKDNETFERFEKAWLDRHEPKPQVLREATPTQRPRMLHPDPVPRILDLLEGVKEVEAGKWNARCPAHEDRHASLSVAQGRSGVVMNCHAGCQNEEIARAIGVPLAEWFDPDGDGPTGRPQPPRPGAVRVPKAIKEPGALPTEEAIQHYEDNLQSNAKLLERLFDVRGWTPTVLKDLHVGWDGGRIVFPVRDAAGTLVNVQRYLPKGQPKMLAPAGRPRNLWPAPETVAGETVWLVEGEPDAVSAHQLGLPGVAIPGVSKWDDSWNGRLAKRRVVVCMDCDEPGRKAAERISSQLAGIVVELRVVDIGPDRDDKFDITDFLLLGGGQLALNRLAAKSPAIHTIGRAA